MAMGKYRIVGGRRLSGEVDIGGAKNAVLPILAAVCLNKGETVIKNCPPILDTLASIEILTAIGCKVDFDPTDPEGELRVDASGDLGHEIPEHIVSKMRSSILFMGAMLGRLGKVEIALPGGCKLGARGIDMHIAGLSKMGATICLKDDKLTCHAERLHGAHIILPSPSVGATENLMIAAVLAQGTTVIQNAACEPEIVDLAHFLLSLGAKIAGAGTDVITITGVEALQASRPYGIMPDRIVAGTYLVAAAITRGIITLRQVCPISLAPVTAMLKAMGCQIHSGKNCVTLAAPERLKPIDRLVTAVHPGFPTDMQAQFVAALALADGVSVVRENIFESRYAHCVELNKMGAEIAIGEDNREFTITGQELLFGEKVAAADLRGGAALVLAGLAACGETEVDNAHFIQRGYVGIEKDLRSLGAMIVYEA